ncbi:unannotated protein [freshwater metagenome]|uniref:Unannotated protein n=1 Tax=freshwater metagenome TaxID=449393 RepID=A0A6J7IIX2_9ZZZZ
MIWFMTIDPASRELLFDAHTAFTFDQEPLQDDIVEHLYELIRFAPTAVNSQPLRLVIVDRDARPRLLPYMAGGNQAKTESAPLTLIAAADTGFHDHLPTVFPHNPGMRDAFLEDEARAAFARAQGWLQVGYVILGIRALGLAAGPMTGFDAAGVTADLLTDTGLEALCVINVGRPGPDAFFPRSPRLAADQVIRRL